MISPGNNDLSKPLRQKFFKLPSYKQAVALVNKPKFTTFRPSVNLDTR